MKTKKLTKKLMLTKETVAHLNNQSMGNIKVGQAADTESDCSACYDCSSPARCGFYTELECNHCTFGSTCDTWCQ